MVAPILEVDRNSSKNLRLLARDEMKSWSLFLSRLNGKRLRDLLYLIAQQMDVDHGCGEIFMTQNFAHGFHINALSEHQSSGRMP